MPTLFQLHVDKWRNCRACELHKTRKHVVFARGSIPCDVLFVGEAPGLSENVTGLPFKGPTGRIMDEIIKAGMPEGRTYCLTNLIGCIPLDEEEGGKASEPPIDSILACKSKLEELVRICQPRLFVAVGAFAQRWTEPNLTHSVNYGHPKVPRIDIIHPAALFHINIVQRGFVVQRAIVQLRQAVERYCS